MALWRKYWPLLFLACAVGAYVVKSHNHAVTAPEASVKISEARIQHILYGDSSGGGHKSGAGKPCKTEFPADWDKNKILGTVSGIAANDNLGWRQENNGYYVTESMVEGVNVRVVMGRDKHNIITAYPINLPRNPCPANDP